MLPKGLFRLASLRGNFTGNWIETLIRDDGVGLYMLTVPLICLIVFSSIIVPQRNVKPPAFPNPTGGEDMAGIENVCLRLAEEHGLSARETEILNYLARGRSQPYIREDLMLSKNTISTHVKHIYQKLNIHSRQELIDLFM